MLGNDVVDLADPETREGGQHPRFDARVFTPGERAALARAGDPRRLRWRLWAAKEAAYKCVKQLDPGVIFSPQRFAVELADGGVGHVEHAGRRLRVALWEEGDALVAVATDGADPEQDVLRRLSQLPPGADARDASAEVRTLARDAAASQVGCAPLDLAFARAGRAPRLWLRGAPLRLALSLAHHGRFVAAAIAAPAGSAAR
jgi:phosphopantetheinyl transferase (holo-ACP synthase)